MRPILVASLIAILAPVARAQEPHVAPNAPRDRPLTASAAFWVRADSAMRPYIAQARATYASARRRFLGGLPAKESFFITIRLIDQAGNVEQAFLAVDSIARDSVYGRIWSQIAVVAGYRLRQPHAVRETDIYDWLITKPDGTEEGNYVGKFLDTYRP
jgi:hypothetical protein